MTTSSKTDAADRGHGGPGSSHQNAEHPEKSHSKGAPPSGSDDGSHARASGGGGERDGHHGHDPAQK